MARYIDISDLHIPEGIFQGVNVPKLLAWLESITPADVEKVKNGYWIRLNQMSFFTYDSFWQCSECRRENDRRTDYCPHCGAKMDEKENENAEIH